MRNVLAAAIICLICTLAQPGVAAQVPESAGWSLTVVGDMMFDRHVREVLRTKGPTYPFSSIQPVLRDSDVVLGNLEGPITSNRTVATDSRLVFTFDPAVAPLLKQVGFTTVSLANNHTLNFGQAGLTSTRQTLQRAGVEYFGDPKNRTGYHLTKTLGQRQVTFLGYHGLVPGIDTVLLDIQRAHAKGEFIIVMSHSGTEYKLGVSAGQQRDYRRLIDAGADLVIGAHPHVVEPLEIYRGKLIAYSLGNFLFDQYFSADTQQGLLLKFYFSPAGTAVRIMPLEQIKTQVVLASGTTKTHLLERLAANSTVPTTAHETIRSGRLFIPTQ